MSTSTKSPSTIWQGGLGASHENAKAPLEIKKPPAVSPRRSHSTRRRRTDQHHSHDPERKGGGSRPAK